ncbi:MAG: DUF1992 domain-containing protein [Chloroflexi bacterium]|nr:DUF1992 domain-containing protein [Chloroflexota bacterium]
MRLRELAEKGELSGLPGEGQPFPQRGDDLSGDRWAAFHILSNEKVLPAWAELRHEIDASAARLVARARRHLAWLSARDADLHSLPAERIVEARATTHATDQRVRSQIGAAVAELNQLVERYEVAVPVESLQMPRFTMDRIFASAAEQV